MSAFLDSYLQALYALTGVESVDGLLGTLALALAVVVIGEFTISIVFRVNRTHIDSLNSRLQTLTELSGEASRRGDAKVYRLINSEANDAYGRVFFNKFGLSAAALWPVFFALDWMQSHFANSGIPVPFYPAGVNYIVVFLLCYILARIVFGCVKRRLPYFKAQYAMLQAYDRPDRER